MPSPEVHYCGALRWGHRFLGVTADGELVTEPVAVRCDLQRDHAPTFHEAVLPDGTVMRWPYE